MEVHVSRNMEMVYPKNISGIKYIGAEKWLEKYYIPVTGIEYQSIYDYVSASFLDALEQYDNDVVYRIAISNMTIINSISMWILEVLRLIRLKEKGYKYMIGTEKVRIPNDISVFKYDPLAKINMIGKNVSKLNYQERIKNVLRTIKYNIFPPVFADKNFLANISSPDFFIGHRSQEEVVAYCKQNKRFPIHLSPLLFANNIPGEANNKSELDGVLEFVSSFLVLLNKQFPEINSSLFGLLRKELEESFACCLLLFYQNVNVFRKFKAKKLLATGITNPVHRVFCASWRYAGGEVIGFVHGNNYSYGYYPGIVKYLSIVDRYITVTAGHKKLLQKAAEEFDCGLRMGNITFLKQSYYERLFTELQRKKPVNKIKNIMLVGFPMTDHYYPFFPGGYAFAQLGLELRLGEILRSKGYNVIYKPHPISPNEVEGIFEGYADEVIKARFEEVFDKADCIIFGDFSTTTFGYSLLSNKPIVLIEVKGNYWYPRAFELIKKRCSVVEAEAVDGKIVFEEKDVVNAVQESINNINYDILNEFAF